MANNRFDQLRAQYRRNADSLAKMADRAVRSNRETYRGYTLPQLREIVATYSRLATATDQELADHIGQTFGIRIAS